MADKLKITGIKDITANSGEEFTCHINPDTIKHTRQLTLDSKNVGDTSAPVSQFQSYGTEKVSFDLVFDNTGAIPGSSSVEDQIEALANVCYYYKGDIHKPNYVLLQWSNALIFRCMLESFSVDYTMFAPNGTPIRAKVSLSFVGYKDPQTRGANANNQSPDMTHAITVREGDSLPLLCKEIYGKMDYYLLVAEHNGLTNFRDLEIGSILEFPPLER